MEILINNIKDYSKKEKTIVIRDNGISLIDGNSCYEKMLSKDLNLVNNVQNELREIMFDWKEEYIGNRKIDGEIFHITVDINHKKKKYKIQNRFPSNWDEFLKVIEEITGDETI